MILGWSHSPFVQPWKKTGPFWVEHLPVSGGVSPASRCLNAAGITPVLCMMNWPYFVAQNTGSCRKGSSFGCVRSSQVGGDHLQKVAEHLKIEISKTYGSCNRIPLMLPPHKLWFNRGSTHIWDRLGDV